MDSKHLIVLDCVIDCMYCGLYIDGMALYCTGW